MSSPPSSILIVGSGVFGLSTALELARRPAYSKTSITVLDRSPQQGVFPSTDASSIDSSRIIRPDYKDRAYANLAAEAHKSWRQQGDNELGGQGRYTEAGLMLIADAPPKEASGSGRTESQEGKKTTGLDYVRESWENVCDLAREGGGMSLDKMRELPSRNAIIDAINAEAQNSSSPNSTSAPPSSSSSSSVPDAFSPGDWGYLNGTSGWADAEKSMHWLLAQVRATNRITFIHGTATALARTDDRVTGAHLSDGTTLSADLVIVATGAWTGALLDLDGQAVATGQVIAYMDITPQEEAVLSRMPVILNFSTGLFVMPPSRGQLKAARHAYGYVNPVATPKGALPTRPDAAAASTVPPSTSLPRTALTEPKLHRIPPEGEADLRHAIRTIIPPTPELKQLHDRPFVDTRICWYTDTASGDFIIDYHPGWKGLFVATAGTGHGFKYLPLIGGRITDCIEGRRPAEFDEKWRWKASTERGGGNADDKQDVTKLYKHIVTEDGSRGGAPGLVLEEELARAPTRSRL